MPLSLMLWALFVVPVWALLLMPLAGPDGAGGLLAIGIVLATAAAFFADRRFGAPGPPRYIWPDRGRWLVFGLVAGLGVTILASDLGNIGAQLGGARLQPPDPAPEPLAAGLNAALFHVGLVLVVVGVAERTLLAIHRPWIAIALAALLGALPTPLYLWPQWALLIGLPAWLFRHTRALSLVLVAYSPTVALPLLELIDVTLGIPGFDVITAGPPVLQPLWFDLLGAALLVLGVGPLLRDFDALERSLEPPEDADGEQSTGP